MEIPYEVVDGVVDDLSYFSGQASHYEKKKKEAMHLKNLSLCLPDIAYIKPYSKKLNRYTRREIKFLMEIRNVKNVVKKY